MLKIIINFLIWENPWPRLWRKGMSSLKSQLILGWFAPWGAQVSLIQEGRWENEKNKQGLDPWALETSRSLIILLIWLVCSILWCCGSSVLEQCLLPSFCTLDKWLVIWIDEVQMIFQHRQIKHSIWNGQRQALPQPTFKPSGKYFNSLSLSSLVS